MKIIYWLQTIYDKGIKKYKKFNRKDVWDDNDVDKWEQSIHDGDVYNPLVYTPIEASIELARATGNKSDEEFFVEAWEDGKNAFLTVIGGNRGTGTKIIIDRLDNKNLKYFYEKEIPVVVTEPLTREEVHRKYGNDANGKPPNRQEIRQGIWLGADCESEFVSKQSVKNLDFIHKISTINPIRMLDDEFVARVLHFAENKHFGDVGGVTANDAIDRIYKGNSTPLGIKKTEYYLKEILAYYNILKETNKNKMKRSYVYGLVLFFDAVLSEGLIWNTKKTSQKTFVTDYTSWWDNRAADIDKMYYWGLTKGNWQSLIRGFNNSVRLAKLKKEIFTLVEKCIDKGYFKLDVKDNLATPEQRNQLIVERKDGDFVWVRQNGIVKGEMLFENLPEFKKVKYLEVKDAEKYPTDHIHPKDEGGKNELNNMEITTFKFNNKKRKKIPNYTKLTLFEIKNK
jgi:hypothetical protein